MHPTELMLTKILNCRRVDLYSRTIAPGQAEAALFDDMKTRWNEGEPIQYILGECDFFGLTLKVDRRVLIPRPETEILVEQALLALRGRENEALKILDIGTGSGNIAIALAKNLPHSRVTTIDISADALQLAKENAALNGVGERINFVHAGVEEFTLDARLSNRNVFDLIISNPPYVSSDQLDYLSLAVRHEPRLALDGGWNGIKFYEPIVGRAERLLTRRGMLFFEVGDGQATRIAEILKRYPAFRSIDFIKDHAGTDRIVKAKI